MTNKFLRITLCGCLDYNVTGNNITIQSEAELQVREKPSNNIQLCHLVTTDHRHSPHLQGRQRILRRVSDTRTPRSTTVLS